MNINKFIDAVISKNREDLLTFFDKNAIIYWHVSNELFTVDEYIKVNCDYPGDYDKEIEIIKETNDGYVVALRVFDLENKKSHHVTSFIHLKDDKIIRLDEYWAEDSDSPGWRKQMHIGKKIL